MDSIILENFRCFRTYQEVPLAPLTFLVGENSTGKTSFLAAVRLAWDLAFGEKTDFNEEPFNLGTFEQIATSPGGKKKPDNFKLGFISSKEEGESFHKGPIKILGSFNKEFEQPEIKEKQIVSGKYIIDIKSGETNRPDLEIKVIGKNSEKTYFPKQLVLMPWNPLPALARKWAQYPLPSGIKGNKNIIPGEHVKAILDIFKYSFFERPRAIAPVRTRPERTYDPKSSNSPSTGEHVPLLLARIKSMGYKDMLWTEIQKELNDFGEASGLFNCISVKELGKPLVDPFQIQVNIANTYSNLVDVGYGVSQVLPILVESVLASRHQVFLLQQPEVHLHPRAQAELGTLLERLVGQRGLQFVVETHSDHLIDRIRLDLKANKPGGLKPEDVLILYFERDKKEVKIHPIRMDDKGNILGAPSGYRSFFMEEERKFWE